MISKELTKRIITSIPLILLLGFSFYYSYVLIIALILVSIVSWIEFKVLINKIFTKNLFILSINFLILIYILMFSSIVYYGISQENFKINMLYLFLICIFSDVGGLLFGKTFKGKRLTKISPNKTISGSIGSFVMSISNFFSGLGKLIFSIKKIAEIKITIAINVLINNLSRELPKLGCLLYLSCILLELI